MAPVTVGVGDVLAVRTCGVAAAVIRLGERLHGLPGRDNHIVIAHHRDKTGVWWGIEGRPGGVGWADLRAYLTDPATVSNADQPRTGAQRQAVADTCAQMLGTPYDWTGIAADACTDLGLPDLFARDWHGRGAPGHVVCSSLAAYAHTRLGLARPDGTHGGRFVQPADWTVFDLTRGWEARRVAA